MPYVRLHAFPSPRPSHAHKPDHTAAKRELEKFVATVKKAVSAARNAKTAAANSVVVDRTGKSFPTIGAAIDSITDATQEKEYVVSAGPGTYNEVVTCKPWVFLTGAGLDQTMITAVSAPDPNPSGIVKGASNSAVQNCTIRATPAAGFFGAYVVGVNCQGTVNFDVENCEIFAGATSPTNIVGFMIDFPASGKSGSQVNVAYTTVTAKDGSSPLALSTGWYTFVHGTESRFIAQGGNQPWGCAAVDQSFILVENCYAEGVGYCLYQDDTAHVTANQCQLVGPVAPGVVVNN